MTDPKFWAILDGALKLEVSKGHMRWTISDLARTSGSGRTLIYYYFGKKKEAIIDTALKIIADDFFGLSAERLELWERGEIARSVMRSREMLERAPHFSEFYFHWRHTPSDIQTQLIAVEKRYLQKLKKVRPSLNDHSARALFTVFFGMVLIPELKSESVDLILKTLDLRST